MKKVFLFLVLILFSLNVNAQKTTGLVTKSMSDKIADWCLYRESYCLKVFYDSNKELISVSDILKGKGREILRSLHKYPQYSEYFLYSVYNIWGIDGFRQLGFTDSEIERCKKIINSRQGDASSK